MLETEIVEVFKHLNDVYQNKFQYPKDTEAASESMQRTWLLYLEEYDYNLVKSAVKKLVLNKPEWPPTVGDIVKEVENMQTPEQDKLEAGEAWEMVLNSIAQYSYFYNPKKVKDSLPDKAKRAAEAVGFALIAQEGASNTFLYNHFKDIYNGLCEKENHNEKLPSSIRKETAKLANGFKNPQLREGKQ